MNLNQLLDYTRQILEPERFRDYCPNGLQVEGRQEVKKIVTGVTASMRLLEAAQKEGADAILVHHGYFWKSEDSRVIGIKKARLKFLLANDISLIAYHLPLDAHPVLGNNAQLGKLMGVEVDGWAGEQNLVAYGQLPQPVTLGNFSMMLGQRLARTPVLIGDASKSVKTIAWCTGAAQGSMEVAMDLGVDLYVSGEISEQTVHLARESGVAYLSAGHHATERYGIKALGEHLAMHCGVEHHFMDIENPV